jgi:hypothetical protein
MALDNGRPDWSGTAWHQKDVPDMWAAVADHTPNAYAAHLAGWRRTSELLSQHVARMLAYRENLAIAWPPDRSPAAAVYLARFDADIDNAQRTLDASVANYAAYAAAMSVVTEAQTAMRPIQAEYAANIAAEEEHRRMVGGVGHRGGAVLAMSAPDVEARQRELTGLARAVMYRTSQELIEATAALQVPPAYRATGANDENSSRSSISPPKIPPVVSLKVPEVHNWSSAAKQSVLLPQTSLTTPSERGPTLARVDDLPLKNGAISDNLDTSAGVKAMNPTPSVIGNFLRNFGSNTAPSSRNLQPQHGVIGTTPHPRFAGNSSTGNGAPQKPNPAPTAVPLLHGGNAGNTAHGQREGRQNLQPDNAWTTEQGTAPVVQPASPEKRIDPGPAIGLGR